MKKLLVLSIAMLFAFSCSNVDPEPLAPKGESALVESVKGKDVASGRIQTECTTGYPNEIIFGTPTTVISNVHYQFNPTYYGYLPYNVFDFAAATLTIKVTNTGDATFKYSTKNGAVWNTLAPAAYQTFAKSIPACTQSGSLNFDLYRLSCGTMQVKVEVSSVTSPHTLTGSYTGYTNIWNAPSCTL